MVLILGNGPSCVLGCTLHCHENCTVLYNALLRRPRHRPWARPAASEAKVRVLNKLYDFLYTPRALALRSKETFWECTVLRTDCDDCLSWPGRVLIFLDYSMIADNWNPNKAKALLQTQKIRNEECKDCVCLCILWCGLVIEKMIKG